MILALPGRGIVGKIRVPGVKPLYGIKEGFPIRSGWGPFTVSHSDVCFCFFLYTSALTMTKKMW